MSGAAGRVGPLAGQIAAAAARSPSSAAPRAGRRSTSWSRSSATAYHDGRPDFAEGRFTYPHTIVDGGLRSVPAAFVDLLAGKHRGNVTVRL
ncbi:hypothetical protein AB0J74_21255 [Asanoa sp. NPDC049573]|uniref:hypothetical protein n=1 Tax=Asanoa sp. NPDC049573 TaxID=3155396 RepID=UPI003426A681